MSSFVLLAGTTTEFIFVSIVMKIYPVNLIFVKFVCVIQNI